ncbi:MAG: PorT family protein [Clostridium sp.]|nr:PorT family protein [Clostridium sp.]
MKKIKYCLTMMLLACTTMSFAQFSNGGSKSSTADNEAWKGLRFSYDLTQPRYTGEGNADLDNYNGFTIGYVHAFNIAKIPLFIETGAGISFARWSDSASEEYQGISAEATNSINVLALRIPVNLVYKVQINDKLAIKPFTGIYLRANLMGKAKEELDMNIPSQYQQYVDPSDYNYKNTYNVFDEDDMGKGGTWNRVQAGWQIGATLDINKFNVGIGYALDFNEIYEEVKNGIFSINVGYNF